MAEIDRLFQKLVKEGGSDLHLTSGQKPLYRESGEMTSIESEPEITPQQMKNFMIEIAPKRNWDEFLKCGDTDFAYEIPNLSRFRANYFMDHHGMGAVFRTIPSYILSMDELGLPDSTKDICNLTKGLVVVTGPTGSGKSTTLAAMIDHLNESRRDHIITVEDPIEFVYPKKTCLINQREVGRHTRSFRTALRAALREDPDIILIGEMRDLETIEMALETAETGHLVFGTLHTTTAPSTVDRLIDQFPADRQSQIRTMLSSSLKAVVAQILCKKKTKGRIAAHEILLNNSAIASNIRESKTFQIPSAMQVGGKQGMRLLNDSLMVLVKDQQIEPVEAYRKSVDKQDMQAKLQGAGYKYDQMPRERLVNPKGNGSQFKMAA